MDLLKIAQMMEAAGFKNVRSSGEYGGIQFQIVGEARIGIQKLPTLVRAIGVLDEAAAKGIADEFLQLHKSKSSYVFGTFFLYCLITERMDQQSAEWLFKTVGQGAHGLKDSLGAGGGHFIMADQASRQFFMMKTKEGTVRWERKMAEVLARAGLVQPP